MTLIAELPELEAGRRQIASLGGVAPHPHESGKFKGRRSLCGRASVRTMLYMAALSAVRHNPPLREHYQALLARGKAKKLALVACMRKLLVILNAIARDASPFNPLTTLTSNTVAERSESASCMKLFLQSSRASLRVERPRILMLRDSRDARPEGSRSFDSRNARSG